MVLRSGSRFLNNVLLVGANPTRQMSFRAVAIGTAVEVTKGNRGRRPLGIPTIRDIRRHGVLDVSTTTDERALPDAVAGLLADCKSAFADAVASLCSNQ